METDFFFDSDTDEIDTNPASWPEGPLPNLCLPVDNPPFDCWDGPSSDGSGPRERLACWFFDVGMLLWEVQLGFHCPSQMFSCPPPKCFLEQARAWADAATPGKAPPRNHSRKREAWLRRQAGVLCFQVMVHYDYDEDWR